jgi:hypothetical protein
VNGGFTILRPADPARRHIVIVKCDICTRGELFDERKVRNPVVHADAIAKRHVCVHPDLTADQMAAAIRELRPMRKPAYQARLSENKKGTMRARVYGSASTGGETDGEHGGRR